MADKRFRSMVEELFDYVPPNGDQFIEAQAQQVIASATHLMRLIRETYSPAEADDLTKRLLSAIKNEDEGKFRRKMRQLQEARR